MEIRILKISNNKRKKDLLGSIEILSIHLKNLKAKGKVTYSTGVPINHKPDYVLLTLGNIDSVCYLCHVIDYAYKKKGIFFIPSSHEFVNNTPEEFKKEKNVSWLVIDSMKKIPMNYFEETAINQKVVDFITGRANNKVIYINDTIDELN